jgi:hypothetical protein
MCASLIALCRLLDEHNGNRGASDEAFETKYAAETAQGYHAVLDRIRNDRKASGASKSRRGKKSSAPAPTSE